MTKKNQKLHNQIAQEETDRKTVILALQDFLGVPRLAARCIANNFSAKKLAELSAEIHIKRLSAIPSRDTIQQLDAQNKTIEDLKQTIVSLESDLRDARWLHATGSKLLRDLAMRTGVLYPENSIDEKLSKQGMTNNMLREIIRHCAMGDSQLDNFTKGAQTTNG